MAGLMCGVLILFYPGDDCATCDDTKYTRPAYPIGKGIAEQHANKNRIDDIGVTKDGNNTRFIRAIGSGNEVLTKQSSKPH